MSKDILIVVDCKAERVKMYAADESIVVSSQGGDELFINVAVGEQLRWSAVPLQFSEGIEGEGEWNVILSKVQLWGAGGAQGEADLYLQDWAINNGGSHRPSYEDQGPISFETSGNNKVSNEFSITSLGTNRPFVECTTALTNRDEEKSPKVAYTFWCQIFKNKEKVGEFSWDPFVTVFRP